MKKIFALLLTGVMVLSMAACSKPAEPDPTVMPDNMASMTAPVDALARCMLENKLEYDPQDPEFFWIALYYFTGGYGLNHEAVTVEDGSYQLQIPTPAMQEHASALFAEYNDLFDLPSIMKGNVSYDPDTDTYAVSRGDIGLSEMKFISYEKTEDGHVVKAQLLSADSQEPIQAYDVVLTENALAESNSKYFYSVKEIVPAETKQSGDAPIVETVIFNGLADSHTAELTLTDGSVQPFQFDADSEVAKTLEGLKEGDGLTIGYTETAGGSLKIVSIE